MQKQVYILLVPLSQSLQPLIASRDKKQRPSLGHSLKDTQLQDSNPDLRGSKPQPDHYSTWHVSNLSKGEDIRVDLTKLILKP